MYFHIGDRITPIKRNQIDNWQNIAAVLTREELEEAGLPEDLFSMENMPDFSKYRGCKLVIEQDRIWGEVHVPAESRRSSARLVFQWWKNSLIFIDSNGIAAECMKRIMQMRPHHADAADDLLMDFFLALIQEDLTEIQALEDRLTALEQDVLENRIDHFIDQMSQMRRALNHRNRYYAQMNNLMAMIQENATDLLDACSQSRLQYAIRRLDRLQNETQMLREYASQVSSEYQAQVDIAQNRIMKLLTIVTTVCMPLSLIAGWYGMNFTGMPELQWSFGYPAVIVLSILVIVGCMLYFRKKHFW